MPPTANREPSSLKLRPSQAPSRHMPETVSGWATGRRVAVSTSLTVPSLSMTASVRSSGLSATPASLSPSPRSTPTAAGLLSSAASRLLRVWGESCSATPWRASSTARSRSSSASACAPSRCAAAAVASARALPRWSSATRPAITAMTSSEATPASTRRRRRCSRPLAAPAVVQERALGRVELGLVLGRPLERGGEARAAVEPARVATVRVPGARGGAEPAMQAAALHVLLEPGRAAAAIRAAAPRARPRPRRRRRSAGGGR